MGDHVRPQVPIMAGLPGEWTEIGYMTDGFPGSDVPSGRVYVNRPVTMDPGKVTVTLTGQLNAANARIVLGISPWQWRRLRVRATARRILGRLGRG